MHARILLLIVILCASSACLAADFSAWSRNMKITFWGYTGDSTLTNFPALVKLQDSLDGFSYSQVTRSDGYDIRFADSSANEIPYEIEEWNTNGTSFLWVRVPELVDADSYITMYWGHASAGQQAYTTSGAVWTNNYEAVLHLNETGTGARVDATANGYDSNLAGTFEGDETAGGIAGGATYFDGNALLRDIPFI